MIYFVSTFSHRYTHATIESDLACFRRISYPELFTRRWLDRGAYIFTDFDRLSPWQLELAAGVYRQLQEAGCRVLNDPAAAAQRLSLLHRLFSAGVNSFKAWDGEHAQEVDRFPVFLRTQAAHRGVLSDLLHTPEALAQALAKALEQGYPRKDLAIVQYCAEPIVGDLFRKLSVYRIGDRTVAACNVHERSWAAKYGELGVASAELYEDEYRIVSENPYGASLLAAFKIAEIEYGRADFGLVGGKAQVYEINSNPSISRGGAHPFPIREKSGSIAYKSLLDAFLALDISLTGRVRIQRPKLMGSLPRWTRLAPGHQWVP